MDRRWLLLVLASCAGPDESSTSQAITQCPDQVVEGVDVYSSTGTIDWSGLKSGGKGFAFIKASQGTYNKQVATFNTYWANSLAAGVLRAPYHFFDPTLDGIDQANYFLANLTQAGGLQIGDLPPLLDLECPTSSVEASANPNCEYTANSGWVDTATLKQRTYDFLNTVQAATGMTPIIYSYASWFASTGFTDPELASYPLFIASYNSCATIPAPWTSAVFWQYSDTGTAGGIAGAVDLDRFFGSAADLAGYTMQSQPPPGVDAGVPETSDAGTTTPPPGTHPGCGCQGGGSPGPLAVGAAALMILLRRRKLAR